MARSLAELETKNRPSILLVGDGGTEKTRFAATCPKPFFLDFDDGMSSTFDLLPRDVQLVETFKDAPWVQKGKPAIDKERGIYPWGESWPRFIEYLNETIWPQIEAGTWPFETLVVDSITTLSAQCMNYVLKSSQKTGKDNPEIQHWGMQLRLMEIVMEQLAAWPIRLVVTAHIKRDDNLVMGTKEFLPMVTGQLSGRLGIYFDEVWYTDVKGTAADRRTVLITQTQASYKQAKSRANVPIGTRARWQDVEPYFQKAS